VADYDGDGRVDLVVAQNGAATRLYRNLSAQPGLRVRLAGPPGNPNGVGATLRLGSGEIWGPAREIHAGSGYWSHDSPVQVMAAGTKSPTHLRAIWPGARALTTELPRGAKELTIDATGRANQSK
jgi:hypothetical protein